MSVTMPTDKQLKPGLLSCALLVLADGCPPEHHMQLCGMMEDDDGCCCSVCWQNYLYYVANARRYDPYRADRIHEGGLIGA